MSLGQSQDIPKLIPEAGYGHFGLVRLCRLGHDVPWVKILQAPMSAILNRHEDDHGSPPDCSQMSACIKAGDRIKTNRRDAVTLARLHRAGELTEVWVPDAAHEAMRDLVRARATAAKVLSKARQHLSGFLLRHEKIYSGVRTWTQTYRRWLTTVRFDHPAQQIVLQDYIDAVTDAEQRVARLTRQRIKPVEHWKTKAQPR